MAYYCEFIVSEQKNMGPIILVPVITNHKPNILYCIVLGICGITWKTCYYDSSYIH